MSSRPPSKKLLTKILVSDKTLRIALELIDMCLESKMPAGQKRELAAAQFELTKAVGA